jgi:hypothetical protein
VKRIIVVFFLFVFVLQFGMKGIITIVFYFQQDAISKTLCENRDKPKMHCNGKCYLAKQLKKEEKKDRGIQKVNKEVVELLMIVPEYYSFELVNYMTKNLFNKFSIDKKYESMLNSLFRPPIV